MRTFLTLSIVATLMFGLVRNIQGQVDVGVSIGEDGLRGFYLAVGDYFQAPEREIIVIRERQIPHEEIPVVFFLATRARVSPDIIVDLRLGGNSWWDIAIHFGLSSEIFYVPVAYEVKGPPYGNAYGHFKKKPSKNWDTIILTDEEILNLTNLKFVSEYYQYSPDKIIEMKSSGKSFVVINDVVMKEKGAKKKEGGKKGKSNRERRTK